MTAVFIPFHQRRPCRRAWPRAAGIFAGCRCAKSYRRPDFVVTEPCDDPDCLVTEPCDRPDFITTLAGRSLTPPSKVGNLLPETLHCKNKGLSSSPGIPGPEVSAPCRRGCGFLQGFSPRLARRQRPDFGAREHDRSRQEHQKARRKSCRNPTRTDENPTGNRAHPGRCWVSTEFEFGNGPSWGRRKSDVLTTEGLSGRYPAPYSLLHALPVPAC